MIPAVIHARRMYPALPNCCDIGTIFLKAPEPIIIPATKSILVRKPNERFNKFSLLSATWVLLVGKDMAKYKAKLWLGEKFTDIPGKAGIIQQKYKFPYLDD